MSVRKLLNSGGALVLMQAVVQCNSLLRNVIIARLITPADFGIAATFAMTVALLEMISNLDADKLLIQADYGNEPRFQHAAQLLQAVRGFFSALVLFSVAEPLAHLFSVPHATWAFRCIAIIPLMKGLAHLDPSRKQRELSFRPTIIVEVTTSLILTLFAVLLGFWITDYSLMLWVLLVQVFFSMLLSHLVAERPYRWALDYRYLGRMARFGWPLLVNGLLLFVIFQGDRFVIGSAPKLFSGNTYTLADLGIYSVAFSLTMAPASVVAAVGTSLFLPLLSRVQDVRKDFERRYVACAQVVCLSAALISIPLIVGGHWLVLLVYGPVYTNAGTFIGWLAAMWALRTIRVAPTLAAIAKGDTRNAMISNIVRTVALVGVFVAAAFDLPLTWVAASGFFGEVLATAANIGNLKRQQNVPVHLCLEPALLVISAMGIAGLTTVSGLAGVHWLLATVMSLSLMAIVILVMLRIFPDFRRDVQASFRPEPCLGYVP